MGSLHEASEASAPAAGADIKQAVQRQFGRAAASYAVSSVHRGGPDLDAMLAAAELDDGSRTARVLDIGTGAGHTAFAFAPHAAVVEALDITEPMLGEVEKGAQERGLGNIRCRLGDAEALPYPDDHFGVVTSRLCAHHLQHASAFVDEAARVLQPGGLFLLVDSVAPEDASQDTFFNTFELLRDPSHVRNHSRSQWRAMLAAAGLVPEALGSRMLSQDFDDWVRRIGTPASAIAHLRFMFDHTHDDQRRAFEIVGSGPGMSLGIPCALIRGRRSAA